MRVSFRRGIATARVPVCNTRAAVRATPGPAASARGQAVDGGVDDVGDRTRALAGHEHQVELDELASLLLVDRADAAARGQGLAHAGAAQVSYDAARVDPWAEPDVLAEGLV